MTFVGLDAEQLQLEVKSAIQSFVFHVATWRSMRPVSGIGPDEEFPPPIVMADMPETIGQGVPGILTFLYLLWNQDQIPSQLGTHNVAVRLPKMFRLFPDKEPMTDGLVMLVYEVEALVGTVSGTASAIALRNAADASIDRLQVATKFEDADEVLKLERFDSEEKLEQFLGQASVRVVERMKVPRIVGERSFWPPSHRALRMMRRCKEKGQELTFEEIEGTSLRRAWDPSVLDEDESLLSVD